MNKHEQIVYVLMLLADKKQSYKSESLEHKDEIEALDFAISVLCKVDEE